MPVAARVKGIAKWSIRKECPAISSQGSDYWNLGSGEFQRKTVLFEYSLITPSMGTVELHHDRITRFDTHLVDAILVAVERQHPAVARMAGCLHGSNDDFRRQARERRLV